jgi:hypothetical protein
MLGAIALGVVMIWLVRSWAKSHNWNDLHLLALASGALVPQTTTARVGLIVLGLVMIVLLALFALQARGRVHHNVDTPTENSSETVVPESVR